MRVSVEEISPIKKRVNVEVPVELVTKEVESFYRELNRKARIKGFRPGKVPRSILEMHFKEYVKAEVIQKLIQESYPRALSEANLHPISTPIIDPGEMEGGKPFQYVATVEVKPEIKVEGYIGLNIEGKKEGVKEEEVEERLKALQNLHSQLKTPSEPRSIQTGDYVILDYQATLGNRPLDEGKGSDFSVEVGSGRFIPEIEESLVGMKPEEEKSIEVSFPEDYGYKEWAGKTVSFHVKIKEIKEKVLPPLDDEFAKDLGDYSSLSELKDKLRQEIAREKELVLERQLKNQIVEQLLRDNPFEVPQTLVEEQTETLVSDTKMRLAAQGIDFESLGVPEEKLQGDYRGTAEKQVRTFLILERIAEQEGITVSDEEIENRFKEMAERIHQKPEAVKRYYEKNGLIPELKGGILSEKVLSYLLERANVTYV